MKNPSNSSVAVLGTWHLGVVYSVGLAKAGYLVTGYDLNKKNIYDLSLGKVPVYEPNIEENLKKTLNKNLFFSYDCAKTIKNKDYIFITLDTPVDEQDDIDLTDLKKLFDLTIKNISPKTIIVISSQVPIGITRKLIKKLGNNRVIYFPENLRLGNALFDFENPSMVVLGADNEKVRNKFLKDFPIFKCEVLKMSIESAEMLKHALNSYLAVNISFSSELSDLCEAFGADIEEVILGLKSDPRVSKSAPINPGIGFSGGTLGRDIKILTNLSKKINYPAKLLNATYSVNQDRLDYLLKKVKKIYHKLKGKKIGILGLTYKPNTSTLRRSQSIELIKLLVNEGAIIKVLDPAIQELDQTEIYFAKNYKDFLKDLDMIILMTPWPEFKNINVKQVANLMNKKVILDTKNFFDRKKYLSNGFIFLGIGIR